MKKIKLCDRCKLKPEEIKHTCPYQQDINDNYKMICNCCKDCIQDCVESI